MENKENLNRGGKRANSGRKSITMTKQMCLKLDKDLYEILQSHCKNKNRYINTAVRIALLKDGLM